MRCAVSLAAVTQSFAEPLLTLLTIGQDDERVLEARTDAQGGITLEPIDVFDGLDS